MKKNLFGMVLVVYAASTLLFAIVLPQFATDPQNPAALDFTLTAEDLAVMSLNAVYPGITEGFSDSRDNDSQPEPAEPDESEVPEVTAVKDSRKKTDPVVFGDDPAVLIVHTHATETYLPATAGNYHSKSKENSVRDAGEVLAESLEEEGIAVIHDETLHDHPSYSSSYSRSYDTIQAILDKYPTIECVIDLHRDAIASEAAAPTVSVGGKNCGKYMYVVSTAVPTYKNNLKFVKALNSVAAEQFSGFTGSVLERGYAYNQGLSDKYLLLEFGNNRNHIEDVRNTARVYGKILAETLKAGY